MKRCRSLGGGDDARSYLLFTILCFSAGFMCQGVSAHALMQSGYILYCDWPT